MLTKILPVLTVSLALAGISPAATLLTPVGMGSATGSGIVNFGGMFDAQPAGIPTVGTATGSYGATYDFYGVSSVGRVGYIDFGSSFSNYAIENIYVELKQFGSNPANVVTYWWSSSTDKTFDGTDVAQSDLGLFNPGAANSNQQWIQTFAGSITIPRQYLLIEYTSGDFSNRLGEVAFAVTTVPEPAAMALIAAGGLLFIRRRRAQAGR